MQSPTASLPSSRRRSRLDSSTSSSSAAASSSKRPKFADAEVSSTVSGGDTMAAALHGATPRAKGKLPDPAGLASRSSAFQPQTGARKLTIKNLRVSSSRTAQTADNYYSRTLDDLQASLLAVFSGGRPTVPLERLYRGVEDTCRKGDADKVHRMLKGSMESHVQEVIFPRVRLSGGSSDHETLKSLLSEWQTWNNQMITVRSTFSFLDRTYLLREKYPSINDMTIAYFRKMAFPQKTHGNETPIGVKFCLGVCELIALDRSGAQRLDVTLLRDSIRMLNVLDVYVKHFEPMFLAQSEKFLHDFGVSRSSSGLKSYIRSCENLLNSEDYRCLQIHIDSTTERQLMNRAHNILIHEYSDQLVDDGSLFKLLADRDLESMKGLYELLSLSRIQEKLQQPWIKFVKTQGASIIQDKERGDEMIIRLLDLRRSLDLMIRDSFKKDETFLWSMRDAFGSVMNDRKVCSCWGMGPSKVGEMIAKHIDMLLRGGLKTLPKDLLSDVKDRVTAEKEGQASTGDEDAELDRQLDQSLELFRFIEGKDAFEAFYKKDLARRLLMSRSASQDAERNMLAKLRGECGSSFTHNLEQMFKDQELAKEEMMGYLEWCSIEEERKTPIDLQVMILSAAAWPTYPDVTLNLPDEVAGALEQFDAFYKTQHKGRNLTWKHGLGHCAIRARFAKGSKELLVSAFQAVVLILFNSVPNDGFLSLQQVSESTGLKGADLKRTLQSLACGKARVLSKHPKGREVGPEDTFTFNKTFWDPKYRVKINQIQLKESKEENKATHERIAQDRRFETQAAIVRIMKSRKKMGHAELTAEVITMTKKRGSVEPSEIKKEIESLIEKEYLEREDGAYAYVA